MKKIISSLLLCTSMFIICGEGIFLGVANAESVAPNLYTRFPDKNDLIPYGDFIIQYTIDDTDSGIDISSDSLTLQKWDGTAWGSDILSVHLGTKEITTTLAKYPVTNVAYGKYQKIFSISDNDGNTTTVSTIFYVDAPEFIISAPELEIGTLTFDTLKVSDQELTVTVKTVGAKFDVTMLQNTDLSLTSDYRIPTWDTDSGFWYTQVSSPSISDIQKIEDANIWSEDTSINQDGEKNTYTYTIKYAALFWDDEYLAGWNYEASINFDIDFEYQDIDSHCWLDGVATLWCDV